MGALYQYVTQVLSGSAVTLTTTAETAVAVTPLPDERAEPALGVLVSGFVSVTTGTTGTSAVVVKIRAGSGTGGTVLQTITSTATTSSSYNIPISYFDQSGAFPIGQYTVTVTQTGATANGSAFGTLGITPSQEA